MQYVHHLVVTTDKGLINPSRLRYVQVGSSYQVRPTLPVGHRFKIDAGESHRYRASREVVGNQTACELDVKCSDRFLRVPVAVARPIAVSIVSFRKSAHTKDLCFAVRTITEVNREQSKIGGTQHGFIRALQQDGEGIGGSPA